MPRRALLLFALSAALAADAEAQVADSSRRAAAAGATVSGVVHDSLSSRPLDGAWVQIVSADGAAVFARTVISDSLGRFAIDDVPDGRYTLGFLHPLLDSLGVEAPLRDVTVTRRRAVRMDLAVPPPARLRTAICSAQGSPTTGGVVLGVVRQTRDRAPLAGVQVTGDWLEYSFRVGGFDRRRERVTATTTANGWFALCNVPIGGTMFLIASKGADSTDLVEVPVPPDGFRRRELFLGSGRTVVVGDTSAKRDSLAPPRRMRVGDGRLRGTVTTAEGNRPLAGAMVRIADGPAARANDRGDWTIVDAPTGTRVLEVRAVGYYPVRRAVDVLDAAPPVLTVLSTFKAVLDTVRIIASGAPDRHLSGFEERQRTAQGRFLTAEDFTKRGAMYISDLFKNFPGVRLSGDSILMRSIFGGIGSGDEPNCSPAFFVDGMHLFELSVSELDNIVPLSRLRAMEVYTESTVPPQFSVGLSGCGAIVIWTK